MLYCSKKDVGGNPGLGGPNKNINLQEEGAGSASQGRQWLWSKCYKKLKDNYLPGLR